MNVKARTRVSSAVEGAEDEQRAKDNKDIENRDEDGGHRGWRRRGRVADKRAGACTSAICWQTDTNPTRSLCSLACHSRLFSLRNGATRPRRRPSRTWPAMRPASCAVGDRVLGAFRSNPGRHAEGRSPVVTGHAPGRVWREDMKVRGQAHLPRTPTPHFPIL